MVLITIVCAVSQVEEDMEVMMDQDMDTEVSKVEAERLLFGR